mmetsp:Transcript_41637/g.89382  ORF Transcript_41637/g.89382 Transcript_41637/m.89382 type:complete len:124 (+) Transcript_41637:340-711(+)
MVNRGRFSGPAKSTQGSRSDENARTAASARIDGSAACFLLVVWTGLESLVSIERQPILRQHNHNGHELLIARLVFTTKNWQGIGRLAKPGYSHHDVFLAGSSSAENSAAFPDTLVGRPILHRQ